ncbi:MAG: sugar nucleotide-binding protein [Clostridiales bacterium]|nr:sugar nucleotide-binding protein [Clostridiales bacterium]
MKNCLVGYTGFVGQNLHLKGQYDGLFNSRNISDAYDSKPDLLVYAGVEGTKYLANHEPEKDLEAKVEALENIRRISPKRLVLISSIDVYRDPVMVDEDVISDTDNMQPYGLNRFKLEQWVRMEFPEALFVRLPGIYGVGLKKNFVFDLIHLVPPMLSTEKLRVIVAQDPFLGPFYQNQGNGYWKMICPQKADYLKLRERFKKIGFSALHFTDSRGIYQYYPLAKLQWHLEMALAANLKVVNIATEPFAISEMVRYIDGCGFENLLDKPIVHYDVRTRHNDVFGGSGGYIMTKQEVFTDLMAYISSEREKLAVDDEEKVTEALVV